jgi:hypothetical protein
MGIASPTWCHRGYTAMPISTSLVGRNLLPASVEAAMGGGSTFQRLRAEKAEIVPTGLP